MAFGQRFESGARIKSESLEAVSTQPPFIQTNMPTSSAFAQ